jgi:glycosyltransferase involved in cell wall biosynthesis
MAPPVVTGLDLPADAPGGSVELFYDLYAAPGAPLRGQAFMLRPATSGPRRPSDQLTLLDGSGKCVGGTPFRRYVTTLAESIAVAIRPPEGAVAHLQHLAFGASPALIAAFPGMTRIALVHGTDLLFAQEHPTQRHVLQQVTAAAAAIVVPTAAMADHLARLAPQLDPARVVNIPWGVPDQLLHAQQPPARRTPGGDLRLLYAGRLTAEKGTSQLITACQRVPGIRLSIAAPRQEYATLSTRMDLQNARVTYLGWLPRQDMWSAFGDHDLLIVPSTTLEAFGLIAVEAQACGLPVAYQPVPGLREILADSALAVDLSVPGSLASELSRLRHDGAALDELRDAGLRNAARYPLSSTARRLADLGEQLTGTPGRPA